MYTSSSFLVTLIALAAPSLAKSKVTKLDVDFSTYKSGTVASFLDKNELYASSYSVASTPLSHTFVSSNVDIVNGALRLKVNGQSGKGDVKSAEVGTYADDILYGTFTTVAKLTDVPGICFGAFTYTDDNHEIDIETLSSYYTKGYGYSVQPGLEFTNQPLTEGQQSTNTAVAYGFDPTADFHNYTIVWTSSTSKFYLDGKLRTTFKKNVPKIAASFLWNAWSSGDVNWSAGPPKKDSYTLIKEIHLAYTTA
ncbi:hypothetical protein JCM10449v2_000079 [Rhodotorula kratochvilovae]